MFGKKDPDPRPRITPGQVLDKVQELAQQIVDLAIEVGNIERRLEKRITALEERISALERGGKPK